MLPAYAIGEPIIDVGISTETLLLDVGETGKDSRLPNELWHSKPRNFVKTLLNSMSRFLQL